MSDDRIITLRFKPENVPDMELYRELEAEKKRLGLSMPVYVKDILQQHFKDGERMWTDGWMERIREIVHGELASQNAVFAGQLEKIAAGIPGGIKNTGQPPEEETLPEYSDDFPEGLNGVLEKFM